MTTSAPEAANSVAMARPSPLLPPVMMAERPVSEICMRIPALELATEWFYRDVGASAKRPNSTGRKSLRVGIRLEADQEPAADVEHRPLDHRRLCDHQRNGLGLAQAGLVGVGQRPESRAGPVEERLP